MSTNLLPPLRITDPAKFGKVAVLMGGWSAERDISLLTGNAVLKGLRERGVDAHSVDPRQGFQSTLIDEQFNRAWIALHGRGGEDGTVQGALEFLKIPYTGSGVLGSAVCMDKVRCKQLMTAAGLATPRSVVVRDVHDLYAAADLRRPLAVKPSHEGSSIGMSRVEEGDDLQAAYERARKLDRTVLIEEWIEGPEYTAGVLGDTVLPLVQVSTPRKFYDYTAKYFTNSTDYQCPCGLEPEVEEGFKAESLRAFKAVGARGWGRVDFMLADDGTAQMLEVNTIPGMTDHSLVPIAARAVGCDFAELVWRILETSVPVENKTA